ncbi:MAG: hypothetical protein J2P50_18225 [Hyphomicrobiaceae bacterium]|nr:hypothetical protein [Hyphomicrobiaceae bacterium]
MTDMEPCRANVDGLGPMPDEADAFAQWAGARRFRDLALERRREFGRPGRNITDLSQHSALSALANKVDWIKAVPVHALQMAVWAIDRVFQRHLWGLGRYPKPREKVKDDSFILPNPADLGLRRYHRHHGAVRIPKVSWITLRGWRPRSGELRSIPNGCQAGHWYATPAWRKPVSTPAPPVLPTVGIDRSIEAPAALSRGRPLAPRIFRARSLAVEPPKRTLSRVGKRKRREEEAHAA